MLSNARNNLLILLFKESLQSMPAGGLLNPSRTRLMLLLYHGSLILAANLLFMETISRRTAVGRTVTAL